MNRRKWILLTVFVLLFSAAAAGTGRAHWEQKPGWFYYDENGEKISGRWMQLNGAWYYFDDSGIMLTGWAQIDGETFFFDEDGAALTGPAVIGGRLYCFGDDRALYTGARRVGDTVLTFTREGLDPQVLAGHTTASYTAEGELLLDADRAEKSKSNIRLIVLLLAAAGCGLFFCCRKTESRAYCLVLYIAVVMSSSPVFLSYLVHGHDMNFHLNRILGIETALRQGMFPVRLNAFSLNGYGYADPVFYPPLFVYIPAILHILGFQFVPAFNLFLLLVNGASAAVMYYCSRSLFRSERIGCISAVIYTLCTYRLCNAYERMAVGELLAMVFLPLVLYGFYELFFGDERRWMFLSLGITGVVQSHVLSTLLIAVVCVAAGLACIRRILTRRRFAALVKMLLSTLLLNLWFLLPLIEYMGTDIDTGSLMRVGADRAIPLAKLIEFFPKAAGSSVYINTDLSAAMASSLGAVIVIGSLLFIYEFALKRKECSRLAVVLFVMGAGFALLATDLFPWKGLSRIWIINMFSSYLQFPWRFLSLASCFLSMACAYAYAGLTGETHKRAGLLVVLTLSLVSSQYLLNDHMRQQAAVWSEDDVNPIIGEKEYMYPNTPKSGLDGSFSASGNIVLSGQARDGLAASFTYSGGGQEEYADVPLLYYPGYHAYDSSGNELDIIRNERNTIRVLLNDAQGTVAVRFSEPAGWRIAECICIASVLWILAEFIRYYGGLKRWRKE